MMRLAASVIFAGSGDGPASITTIAVARPTRPSVFNPIGLLCRSRLSPIRPPASVATPRRSKISGQSSNATTSCFGAGNDRPMSVLSQSPNWYRPGEAESLFRQTPHDVEFVVRAHAGDVGHPVRQCEERRDRGDIPNVVVAKTVAGDGSEIRFRNPVRFGAHLHREVEHGSLARRDIRLAVIDGDLV